MRQIADFGLLVLAIAVGIGPAQARELDLTPAQQALLRDLDVLMVAGGGDGPRAYVNALVLSENGLVDLALSPSGRVLGESDLAEMVLRYEAAQIDLVGKMDVPTRTALNAREHEEVVSAVVVPEIRVPQSPPPEEIGDVDQERGANQWRTYYVQLSRARASAQFELADHLEGVVGFTSRGVILRTPRSRIEEVARRTDVSEVVLLAEDLPPTVGGAADANVFINFDTLRNGPIAWDGNGNGNKVEVGFVETGTGPSAYPRLPPGNAGIVYRNIQGLCFGSIDCGSCGAQPTNQSNGCRCINNLCWDNHGSRILSVLGAQDGGMDVGVRGARVYYDNDSNFSDSIAWLASNDVHVMSLSQIGGTISAAARDAAVRDDNIALFNLAGNQFPVSNSTTCRPPNVICVGNYDHTNGVINQGSNWVDFNVPGNPQFDREQPDLVAPGTSLRLWDSTGVFALSTGTSFATPMAASVLVALHDVTQTNSAFNVYYPSFEHYPEASKAIMMAASTTNVSGGLVSDESAPDDRDGAGVIDVESLERIYNNAWWSIQWRTPADPQSMVLRTVNLAAGQTLRAYLVWSRCPSNTLDALNADLDLRIKGPNGQWVAFGDSFFQTYEAVSYTATQAGSHELYLTRWYMNGCGGNNPGEIVGLAYDIQ